MARKKKIAPLQISQYILWGMIIVALLILNYWYLEKYLSFNSSYITDYQAPEDNLAQYRNPAVAGLFYSASPKELEKNVDEFLKAGYFNNNQDRLPKMIIVPHAGYIYSAGTAGKAYALLQGENSTIKNIILLGPSHYYGGQDAYLSDVDYFKTPLGNVSVNKKIVRQLAADNKSFKINNQAHAQEHSLEVQLPFIQKVLPKAQIIPIIYGNIEPQKIVQGIEKYLKRQDTILVVSADLSHYHQYAEAQQIDVQTAEKIEAKQALENHESCGAIGINSALILAKQNEYRPQILELINSGDVSGNKQKVVGYGAWGFYPDGEAEKQLSKLEQDVMNLQEFSKQYKKNLIQIVHTSLRKAVEDHKKHSPSRQSYPEDVFDRGASFITLYKNGELRGCIGSILPTISIAQDIADNTYAAALEDKRFSPVRIEELSEITYTISLLSGFEEIRYHDEKDLLQKIIENIDGIVIRDGNRQGVFLPSVWEQLPDKEEFFKHLKIKAGMNPNYWNNRIKVYRFRTVEIKNED